MSLPISPIQDGDTGELAAEKINAAFEGVNKLAAALPRRVTASYTSGRRTITATPVLLNASGTDLTGRRWLIVRNESTDTRLRYGVAQADLQRDGEVIEPQAVAFIEVDSETSTPIYGCSEGRSIIALIAEDAE